MKRYGFTSLLLTFFIDQLTKWAVVHVIMNPPRIIPVTPFFNLVLAWNTGVSFSLFASSDKLQLWSLVGLTSLIAIVLFSWMLREKNFITCLGLGMIVGGAIGNIVDRVIYGAVIDYLQFYVGSFYWPAFNMADAAICVAAGLMIMESLGLFKRKVI